MTQKNLLFPSPGASDDLAHLDPIPSYEESVAAPRPSGALQILGATWGGVTVTPEIQALVDDRDTLTLDMRDLWRHLTPDPAPGKTKVLTVLYRFDDGTGQDDKPGDGTRLLVIPETDSPSRVTLARHASAQQLTQGSRTRIHRSLAQPFNTSPSGQAYVLAVVYGPKVVEHPAALEALGLYFEGRRGQIRMNNAFFGGDTWPYKVKSWTVYFRFVGSKRVQAVTGWEDGALEVPWSRYY
ncbi:hypothetical protein N0V88_006029 [Collariella sp. IMI 366227]|nr:hypothetical protein N0V88_006029 [Collariella sp. IMI 366227]